jgi:hypothetical protein
MASRTNSAAPKTEHRNDQNAGNLTDGCREHSIWVNERTHVNQMKAAQTFKTYFSQ